MPANRNNRTDSQKATPIISSGRKPRSRRERTPKTPKPIELVLRSPVLEASADISETPKQELGAWIARVPFNADAEAFAKAIECFCETFLHDGLTAAQKAFNAPSKKSALVALLLWTFLHEEQKALQKSVWKQLKKLAEGIALSKGLGDPRFMHPASFNAALDRLFQDIYAAYPTARSIGRLLFYNRVPSGAQGRFDTLIFQRLCEELQEQNGAKDDAFRYAMGEGALETRMQRETAGHPDSALELVCAMQQQREHDPWTNLVFRKLYQRLTSVEWHLLLCAGRVKNVPAYHWKAAAQEFADPRTGCAPSAASLRKAWNRLKLRLEAMYREITGRLSPTGPAVCWLEHTPERREGDPAAYSEDCD
ncbi:MAG: hypothetical protein ACRD4R_08630 [Candidatus Acidiferrales bacterium]